jgi:hypothetical protein
VLFDESQVQTMRFFVGILRATLFKDMLTRLPTQPAARIEELLPHRWQPDAAT